MKKEITLCGTWLLSSKRIGIKTIPAIVPGDIHSALIDASVIKEPLHDRNVLESRWVENTKWTYERSFQVPASFIGKRLEIFFEGLDTTAEIFINDQLAGKTDNALVYHVVDVTPFIHAGKNNIRVQIDDGVLNKKKKELRKYGQSAKSDGWKIWMRKPMISFGGDFAPHLLTCGIWRPVTLKAWDRVAIRECFIKTKLVGKDAVVTCEIELESFHPTPISLSLEAHFCGATEIVKILAKKGINRCTIRKKIKKPRLWWPNGMGEPTLYNFTLCIKHNGYLLDEYKTAFGIRIIRLIQEKLPLPEGGKSFIFEINGKKVFSKGACWAPPDSIFARIGKDKYHQLVDLAAQAHFNMFRVWGGGIYPDDAFYKACDKKGIMVWQDFMFACSMVPDDDSGYREAVRTEAKKVIRRVRNHPSIVLWCGNNENQEAHAEGWIGDPKDTKRVFYGKKIYHEILPACCEELDGTRPYWPGSPFGGKYPNSDHEGDMHAWGVSLHGGYPSGRVDYRNYRKVHGRFISEFGLLSMPCYESIKRYIAPDQRNLKSKALQFHVNLMNHAFKPDDGPGLLERQIDLFFGNHRQLGLRDFIRISQIIQGEGYKYAIEHFRRRGAFCGGSLFWMFADSWGELGWTVVDYYLNKKLSYYLVKKAYEPILVSIKEEEHGASVWIINDTDKKIDAELEFGLKTFTGEKGRLDFGMNEEKISRKRVVVAALSVAKVAEDHLDIFKAQNLYYCKLRVGGKTVSENILLPHLLPNLNMPRAKVAYVIADGKITLKTDNYAHRVVMEFPQGVDAEDNAFSILPGESKTVRLSGPISLQKKIKVTWLNSTLKKQPKTAPLVRETE